MTTEFHVGRPYVHSVEGFLSLARQILESKRLTNDGPTLQQFERELRKTLQVRNVIAVCNATVGLQILLRAVVGDGDGEVIVPAFTFVATAQAPLWIGLRPVLADVDPVTHCLSPAAVERCLTPATRAIIGVHLWGRPCAIDQLTSVAESARVPLIFDAAHAFGCKWGGRSAGGAGAGEVFSFHATKFFNTFEGGAIATDDDTLADRCRKLRNFGFTGIDQIESAGTNGKMSEVCAAMGLVNLPSLDEIVAHNKKNFDAYDYSLQGLVGLSLYRPPSHITSNHQYVVAKVDDVEGQNMRDVLACELAAEGVLARRYFYPGMHRIPPFEAMERAAAKTFPATEALASRILVLPTGPAMSTDDIVMVAAKIRRILNGYSRYGAPRGQELAGRRAAGR